MDPWQLEQTVVDHTDDNSVHVDTQAVLEYQPMLVQHDIQDLDEHLHQLSTAGGTFQQNYQTLSFFFFWRLPLVFIEM